MRTLQSFENDIQNLFTQIRLTMIFLKRIRRNVSEKTKKYFQTFLIWLSVTFSKTFFVMSVLIYIFCLTRLNFAAMLLVSFISLIIVLFTYNSMKKWDDDIFKNLWPDKIDTDDDMCSMRDKMFTFPVFIASIISASLSLYLSY